MISETKFSKEEYVNPVESNKIINIDKASANLNDKLQPTEDNVHLVCERVEFHSTGEEMRCFYIFRRYENYPDHCVTIGWYVVDIETGECFDTNVLTEWDRIE